MLNRYCNRFGWAKDVVDACPSTDLLLDWAKERRIALENGHDYRSATAVFPGGD